MNGDEGDSDEDDVAYNELGADGVLGVVLRTALHLEESRVILFSWHPHIHLLTNMTHLPSHQHDPPTFSPA